MGTPASECVNRRTAAYASADTHHRAHQREGETLGEQLSQHARAGRAQRRAKTDLALAGCRAAGQQRGDVRGGDQQNQSHRGEEHGERTRRALRHRLLKRRDERRHFVFSGGDGFSTGQIWFASRPVPHDGGGLLCTCATGHARFQTSPEAALVQPNRRGDPVPWESRPGSRPAGTRTRGASRRSREPGGSSIRSSIRSRPRVRRIAIARIFAEKDDRVVPLGVFGSVNARPNAGSTPRTWKKSGGHRAASRRSARQTPVERQSRRSISGERFEVRRPDRDNRDVHLRNAPRVEPVLRIRLDETDESIRVRIGQGSQQDLVDGVNIADVAPMPSASVRVATGVKAGMRRSVRNANRKSENRSIRSMSRISRA